MAALAFIEEACGESRYAATEIEMLLASPTVFACVLSSRAADTYQLKLPLVLLDQSLLQDCIELLRELSPANLRYLPYLDAEPISTYVVYVDRTNESSHQRPSHLTARQFLEASSAIQHLNLTAMDVPVDELVGARAMRLRSLDMSRLDLTDDSVISFLRSGRLRSLRWLDLSGNRRISVATVDVIADMVQTRQLPFLEWVDLLGTACDATPYIDGYFWRIAPAAREIAKRRGYQRWMMLGSKLVEMANRELLNESQRRVPPDRFSLP